MFYEFIEATLDVDTAFVISAIGGICTAVWIVATTRSMALSLKAQLDTALDETSKLDRTLTKLITVMEHLENKLDDHSRRIEKLESSLTEKPFKAGK